MLENVASWRIQIISILVSFFFLIYVSRLIIKGKLRAEYSIIWIINTIILIVFSFWRSGLDVLSRLLGIYAPPNLVFICAIFMILIYLLHLSIVISKLHEQNKTLIQEITLLKKRIDEKENKG